MSLRTLHPGKLLLFVALSACDLLLTWYLLEKSGGTAYEANPVAAWWLARCGWAGMAGFKFAIVLLVIGLCAAISLRRSHAGGRLLLLGCTILAGVIGYSGWLLVSLRGDMHEQMSEAEITELDHRLDVQMVKTREHHHLMQRMAADLVAERCTLTDAVATVAASAREHNPVWLKFLGSYYPNRTEEECIAASLLMNAFSSVSPNPSELEEVARRLEAQFRATFGSDSPCNYADFGISRPLTVPRV